MDQVNDSMKSEKEIRETNLGDAIAETGRDTKGSLAESRLSSSSTASTSFHLSITTQRVCTSTTGLLASSAVAN